MRLLLRILIIGVVPVLAVGITLATVDVPSVSALSFVFIGDVYGYGFPLPWKYYPILGRLTCLTCPPIPPSYNWFLFTLDVCFYMAIEYAVLLVYVKYHADKRSAQTHQA